VARNRCRRSAISGPKIASPRATARIARSVSSGPAPFSWYPRAPARIAAKTNVFGQWLAWLGAVAALVVVVACAVLSGVLAIPAVLVWALAASAALWRAPR